MYYSNPEDFSKAREDDGSAPEIDYAHPEYYQSLSESPTPSVRDPYVALYDPYAQGYTGTQQEALAPEQPVSVSTTGAETNAGKRSVAGLSGQLLVLGGFLFKFGVLGISALVSVFAYSLIFGWPLAVGLVLLLFIHEMGHALVMKLKGIPMGGMIFIPMLGAAVTMQKMPQNAKDEAEVGIAGPIAGALAASVCFFLAQQYPGTIWAPLAYFGFLLNLFNLIPIVPFDGGRVLAAIDRRVWILGFVILLGYQVWQWINGNFYPWLLLFIVMAATQLWSRSGNSQDPQTQNYYRVALSSRILMGLLYFGLVLVLFLGMTVSHGMLPMAN